MTLMKFSISILLVLATQAWAQTRGDWSGSYGFPSNGASRQVIQLTQSDLIAKKEAGYYDGLGKNTFYTNQVTTYSVGALNQSTTSVTVGGTGNQVGVSADSGSAGNIDGSVGLIDISRSTVGGVQTGSVSR